MWYLVVAEHNFLLATCELLNYSMWDLVPQPGIGPDFLLSSESATVVIHVVI